MKKGVITVYLTITFTVLLSMFFAFFEGAKISAYRVMAESAFQGAVVSGFGEYHKMLLSKYDVFFVDLSYQTDRVSKNALSEHVSQYLNGNLSVPEKRLLYAGDFFGDAATSVSTTSERYATNRFGAPFRNQAVGYMKDLVSADFAEDFLSLIRVKDEYALDTETFDTLKEKVASAAEEGGNSEIAKNGDGEETEAFLNDGAFGEIEAGEEDYKTIRSYQNFDLRFLYFRTFEFMVLKAEAAKKSGKIFNPADVPSGRISSYSLGDGELIESSISPVDEIFFNEYVMQKCSNYLEEKEGSFLCYETEYLIAGKNNDSENLVTVMETVFLIRTVANMVSLRMDREKTELIEGVASVLSAVTEVPQKVVEIMLLCMWAGGEAIYDLQDLYNGERVSLIKDADDFRLSLKGGIKAASSSKENSMLLLTDSSKQKTALSTEVLQGEENALSTQIANGRLSGKTFPVDIRLSYKDYLRILLFAIPSEIKTMRMLDVVELSIRQTKNNETFRMDYCVDAAIFEVRINTAFSAYTLKRRYSYF